MDEATGSPLSLVQRDLVTSLDECWQLFRDRIGGLADDEYLWEPAHGSWTLRPTDVDGVGAADWADPDPVPAPLTTIAWRTWHVAVDCLDSYSSRVFERTGTGLTGPAFPLDAERGIAQLDLAWGVFRDGVAGLAPARLADLLGPAWGPFAESTVLALVLHALHEVVHHGAEIALLRDLYAAREPF